MEKNLLLLHVKNLCDLLSGPLQLLSTKTHIYIYMRTDEPKWRMAKLPANVQSPKLLKGTETALAAE